jgi:hypothetical protein
LLSISSSGHTLRITQLGCGTLSFPCITFLSPLRGYLFQQQLQEWPHRFISFYSTSHSKLIPKCHLGQFVAYEWQWTSLGNKGTRFFIHWFLGQLVRLVVHHIQLKNQHGRSSSFYKNGFCKKNGWPCSVFWKLLLYLLKLNLSHKYDPYCTWA